MTTFKLYLRETWVLDDNGWHSPYETLVWKGNAYQGSEQTLKEAEG